MIRDPEVGTAKPPGSCWQLVRRSRKTQAVVEVIAERCTSYEGLVYAAGAGGADEASEVFMETVAWPAEPEVTTKVPKPRAARTKAEPKPKQKAKPVPKPKAEPKPKAPEPAPVPVEASGGQQGLF